MTGLPIDAPGGGGSRFRRDGESPCDGTQDTICLSGTAGMSGRCDHKSEGPASALALTNRAESSIKLRRRILVFLASTSARYSLGTPLSFDSSRRRPTAWTVLAYELPQWDSSSGRCIRSHAGDV